MTAKKFAAVAAAAVMLAFTIAFVAAAMNRSVQIRPGASMFRGTDKGTEVCTARSEPLFGPVTCLAWQPIGA